MLALLISCMLELGAASEFRFHCTADKVRSVEGERHWLFAPFHQYERALSAALKSLLQTSAATPCMRNAPGLMRVITTTEIPRRRIAVAVCVTAVAFLVDLKHPCSAARLSRTVSCAGAHCSCSRSPNVAEQRV